MKQIIRILALFSVLLTSAVYTGCLKDGEDGSQGPQGATGPTGTDGKSGEAKCQVCHNDSSAMLAKILQYRNSTHAAGTNSGRSDATCAKCHTNEGFIKFVKTGIDSVPGGVANPTPQNCRTCHMIHTKFDTTDFRQRLDSVVEIKVAKESHGFGTGSSCGSCHQPRTSTPLPKVGGDSVTVTNYRWGPHYGTQATILAGIGAYKVAGSIEYTNSEHTKRAKNSCVDCHMGKPYGQVAGGHTLRMSYGDTAKPTPLLTSCVTCHTDGLVKNFNYKLVQDTVKMLMDSLKVQLVKKKILVDSTGLAKNGKYSADVAGAYWNYKLVYADRSKGNHNYPFTKALLTNSIEALKK